MSEPEEGGARRSVTVRAKYAPQFLLNPEYFSHMIFNMCDILVQKCQKFSDVRCCDVSVCRDLRISAASESRHTVTSDLTCHVTPRTHLLRSLSCQILIPHKCRKRFYVHLEIFVLCEKLNIREISS